MTPPKTQKLRKPKSLRWRTTVSGAKLDQPEGGRRLGSSRDLSQSPQGDRSTKPGMDAQVRVWGPIKWKELHTRGLIDLSMDEEQKWFETYVEGLPCPKCRSQFQAFLADHPPD